MGGLERGLPGLRTRYEERGADAPLSAFGNGLRTTEKENQRGHLTPARSIGSLRETACAHVQGPEAWLSPNERTYSSPIQACQLAGATDSRPGLPLQDYNMADPSTETVMVLKSVAADYAVAAHRLERELRECERRAQQDRADYERQIQELRHALRHYSSHAPDMAGSDDVDGCEANTCTGPDWRRKAAACGCGAIGWHAAFKKLACEVCRFGDLFAALEQNPDATAQFVFWVRHQVQPVLSMLMEDSTDGELHA